MRIFISWSGERSKVVAEALRRWIPDVVQSVDPWMSGSDIEAGARWNERMQRQLSESRFGILCITRDNLASPWLLFEAGALAKTIEDTFVCPYLVDLEPSDLPQGPLVQFQAKRANQVETRELLLSINQSLGEQRLDQERVDRGFERWWPDLEKTLRSLPTYLNASDVPQRTPQEMLEEILLLVRRLERQSRGMPSAEQRALESLITNYIWREFDKRRGTVEMEKLADDLLLSISSDEWKERFSKELAELRQKFEIAQRQDWRNDA